MLAAAVQHEIKQTVITRNNLFFSRTKSSRYFYVRTWLELGSVLKCYALNKHRWSDRRAVTRSQRQIVC